MFVLLFPFSIPLIPVTYMPYIYRFQIPETFVQTKENVNVTSASATRQLMADIQANGVRTVR